MSYAIPTLTQARNIIKDPAPMWRWTVVMPGDIKAPQTSNNYSISGDVSSYDSGGFSRNPTVPPDTPVSRVENIQLSGLTIDTDPRFGAAAKTMYPRFLQTNAMTISFYEDSNYNTMKYLRAWREMVVDRNHNFYPADQYKKSIIFFAFNIKSNDTPTFIFQSIGTFPVNPGDGLQYELTNSGIVVVPCSFSVDDVEMHWNPSAETP